jgi:hypothetical protein
MKYAVSFDWQNVLYLMGAEEPSRGEDYAAGCILCFVDIADHTALHRLARQE